MAGFLSCASGASLWRGYEYYEAGKVVSWVKTGETQYEGDVSGSSKEPYHVKIDIMHPRKHSSCNCPHADGKKITCKHQVALYFTLFPKEAKRYKEEVDKYEREEEQREQELYEDIVEYVNSLSPEELRAELINALIEAAERDRYW